MTSFVPNHYSLRIQPDLVHFQFSAETTIQGWLPEPGREFFLHTLELEVEQCEIKANEATQPCLFRCEPGRERLVIILPQEYSGSIVLSIRYRGTINDRMAGLYRSGFSHNGESGFIALTQFQESDARRAFPCLDLPGAKATFDVELIVPRGQVAIGNSPIAEENDLGDGLRRVRFERTPRMSTYLLFFGIGPFAIYGDQEDPRVRLITLPWMQTFGQRGLEFGRKALTYCEQYYRIDYPLAKMDLIAVPDFAFGAMENWGAITFRENLLLFFPGITSRLGEERICEVIAHEIAHQWFGNLVTPAEWSYLWLNESFATYFGFNIVNHHHPEWDVWQQFLARETETALARDSLVATFPIEIPGGNHVAINESTAPIIYSKGGSILRQIESYVGSQAFRDGLTHYLNRHAYDVAASHHLWDALEETAHKPITHIMKSWVEQAGHPILRANRNGDRLTIRQQRFTYLSAASENIWQIPVQVRAHLENGEQRDLQFLLTSTEDELSLPPGTTDYLVNAGHSGFYRVHYAEKENRLRLGGRIRRGEIAVEDRWGLQRDLFALLLSGAVVIEEYLDFLSYYEDEADFLPLASIAQNLRLAHRITEDDGRVRIEILGRNLLENALSRLGWMPRAGESHNVSILRDQILWDATVFGSATARDHGLEIFSRLRNGQEVPADLRKAALQISAAWGDSDTFQQLQTQLTLAPSEHDRMNILVALGAWRDPLTLQQALDFTLDEVPPRNRFVPIVAAAANPWAGTHLWDWYEQHVEQLEQLHPMLYERIVAAIIPASGAREPRRIGEFFRRYLEDHPELSDVVELSLEKMDIYVRLRTTNQTT